MTKDLTPMSPHSPLGLSVLLSTTNRLTLVVAMFSARQGQLDLCSAAHEIDSEGDECQPLFGNFPVKAVNFATMEQ